MRGIGKLLGSLLRPYFSRHFAGPASASISRELSALGDNALFMWSLRRVRREPVTLVFSLVYLVALYGLAAFLAFVLIPPTSPWQTGQLLQSFHVLAWGGNAIVLLLVVPLRFAQQLATERERRTIEFLKLTSLPGRTIAFGSLAAAYAFPLLLCATSLPLVIAGAFSDRLSGIAAVASAYTGLAATSLLYTLVAGLVGFVPKKASQAGGAAVLALLALAIVGGFYSNPHTEPLGCLGPWGAFLSGWTNEREQFVLAVGGAPIPGILVQLPLDLLLAGVLYDVVARRITGEDPRIFGLRGGLVGTLVIAVAAVVTYSDTPPSRSSWGWPANASQPLGYRYVALFMALLPLAADAAVPREDLVRGLARHPGDPPRREETLRPLEPVLAAGLVAAVLTLGLIIITDLVRPGSGTTLYEAPLAVAAAALVGAVGVAASMFQAARLLVPYTAPNALAAAALLGLWVIPLLASRALHEVGAPEFLESLPLALCLFAILYSAAAAAPTTAPIAEVSPVSLAVVAVMLDILIIVALQWLIRNATASATELARSLVVLPADAIDAPQGALARTCARGHVFAATWGTCPHCK